MDIKGHAAFVTGGASGLGAATAAMLAAPAPRSRCSTSISTAREAVAEKIGGIAIALRRRRMPSKPPPRCAQARDASTAPRASWSIAPASAPAKRIVGRDGPMPLGDFERVIKINLIGTFNMMRLAAADMRTPSRSPTASAASIISTASVAAYRGPDRPGRLCRLQGRRRRADPAGGARVRAVRHPRLRHRAGHLP